MEINKTNERNSELLLLEKIHASTTNCKAFYSEFYSLEQEREHIKNACAAFLPIRFILGCVSLICFIESITEPRTFLKWAVITCVLTVLISVVISTKREQGIKRIKEIKKREKEILNSINNIYINSCLEGIYPQKLFYNDAADFCYSAIKNMRVSTIIDAIRLYEDEVYKPQMTAMAQSSVSMHRDLAERLSLLENESVDSEASAQLAAILDNVIKEKIEPQTKFAMLWPKISVGTIALLLGFGVRLYGYMQNRNFEAQLNSVFSSGSTNPGDPYIVIGYALIALGILSMVYNYLNTREK